MAILIAQATPQRTLVYSYNASVIDNATSASGAGTTYSGAKSDSGTITIDVMGIFPDEGLSAKVSETGRDNRVVAPLACTVYASTKVTCQGTPTPEELAVLRSLNPKFLDPGALDAARHWHIALPNDSTVDYAVGKVDAGGNFPISGVRQEKYADRSVRAEISYAYNSDREVASQIKESQTVNNFSAALNSTLNVDVTANLQSDSAFAN